MTKEIDVMAVVSAELPLDEKQEKSKPHRWQPGESGNPKGRPKKGYSISEMMKELLESDPEKKRALVEAILAKAMTGDVAAMKAIWNYMDGMPLQATDVTSQGEKVSGFIYLPEKKPEGDGADAS